MGKIIKNKHNIKKLITDRLTGTDSIGPYGPQAVGPNGGIPPKEGRVLKEETCDPG